MLTRDVRLWALTHELVALLKRKNIDNFVCVFLVGAGLQELTFLNRIELSLLTNGSPR
jgi:hypothetical protein